jgi:hypothetical protein
MSYQGKIMVFAERTKTLKVPTPLRNLSVGLKSRQIQKGAVQYH